MKKETPYLTALIQKLAPKVGAKVIVEPKWKIVAQIRYKNGVNRYLRFYTLDLNPVGASDIAKDKGFAKFFMQKMGYPTAKGKEFFKPSWAKVIGSKDSPKTALNYAKKIGYPLIVKPNSSSQGYGVTLVHSPKELLSALNKALEEDRVAIVEEYKPGKDYRVVTLDGKIISAYERIALSVTGDGQKDIRELLLAKQKLFKKKKRDTRIDMHDPRILKMLKSKGKNLKTVLAKNESITLLPNANLSTGGESKDVTNTIHPKFKKLATRLTKDMGLRIAGVDIMVTEGDITEAPKKEGYYIIEINAAPGLDHYVTTGKAQEKIVEAMYLKVLKAMKKR